LERREREANVDGAFRAVRRVDGLEVILVDDVYTSGATTTEASIALIAAGAKRVRIVTLARARNDLSPPSPLSRHSDCTHERDRERGS
jgi:predicted amidophosphoribosyltransferase